MVAKPICAFVCWDRQKTACFCVASVETATTSAAVCLTPDTVWLHTHNFLRSTTIKPLSLMQPIGSFVKLCVHRFRQGISQNVAIKSETLWSSRNKGAWLTSDSVARLNWLERNVPYLLTFSTGISRKIRISDDCDTYSLCPIYLPSPG